MKDISKAYWVGFITGTINSFILYGILYFLEK